MTFIVVGTTPCGSEAGTLCKYGTQLVKGSVFSLEPNAHEWKIYHQNQPNGSAGPQEGEKGWSDLGLLGGQGECPPCRQHRRPGRCRRSPSSSCRGRRHSPRRRKLRPAPYQQECQERRELSAREQRKLAERVHAAVVPGWTPAVAAAARERREKTALQREQLAFLQGRFEGTLTLL